MKNLLERLKPEVLAAMEADNVKFPYIVEEFKEKLSLLFCIQDIKLGDAEIIHEHGYGIYKPFRILDFYKLFNDYNYEEKN